MKRVFESIRIEPILGHYGTAAGGALGAGNGKVLLGRNANFAVVCGIRMGSTLATGVTATAANFVQFAVYESTAASDAGTAITGATVTLGAATAAQARGLTEAILKVTTALTTAVTVNINGIDVHTLVAGAGSSGENVAADLASAINGMGRNQKIPHYHAIANYGATGQVLIEADDDLGTGLTIITTAAASTIVPLMTWAQGIIEIDGSKLSTNSPKYISVQTSTYNGTTAVEYAFVVRKPTGAPAMPGRLIELTT